MILPAESVDPLEDARPFLQQCPPCDLGLPYPCSCPGRDFRPVMSRLVLEVFRLRTQLAEIAEGPSS